MGQRRVGGQGFLEPAEGQITAGGDKAFGFGQVPRLIGVGAEGFAGAKALDQGAQERRVPVLVEADFDLEGRKPQCAALGDLVHRLRNRDAAGIASEGLQSVRVEKPRHRQPGATGFEIGHGGVEARDHLPERPPFATLQGADMGLVSELGEEVFCAIEPVPQKQIGHVLDQQPGAVFGPGGGPVGEYLTPAEGAVAVFQSHKDCGAVQHDAKGCGHRRVDGHTAGGDGDAGQGDRHECRTAGCARNGKCADAGSRAVCGRWKKR